MTIETSYLERNSARSNKSLCYGIETILGLQKKLLYNVLKFYNKREKTCLGFPNFIPLSEEGKILSRKNGIIG